MAQLTKNRDISPIYGSEPEDEAVRDLSRARETAMKNLKNGKHQLKSMLLSKNINDKINDN